MAFIAPNGDLISQVSINSPHRISSKPLQGSYRISCKDDAQVEFLTREISIHEDPQMVALYLQLEIPFLLNKIVVRDTEAYDDKVNGVSLALIFLDMQKDVTECQISSGEEDPIVGSEPLKFTTETLQ